MKLASVLGGIQQAGAPKAGARLVTPCLTLLLVVGDCKRLDTSLYFIITNFHTELTLGKGRL